MMHSSETNLTEIISDSQTECCMREPKFKGNKQTLLIIIVPWECYCNC